MMVRHSLAVAALLALAATSLALAEGRDFNNWQKNLGTSKGKAAGGGWPSKYEGISSGKAKAMPGTKKKPGPKLQEPAIKGKSP